MQKKETLISFPDGKDADKDVSFVFSHSALKEGWDNPNVFQICTLKTSGSETGKRQEVGRGFACASIRTATGRIWRYSASKTCTA